MLKNLPPPELKVLVLSQNYVPLNIVHWKRAVKRLFSSPCLYCSERGYVYFEGEQETCVHCSGTGILSPAIPVEYFSDGYSVQDGRGNTYLVPAVLANAHHIKRKYCKVSFSKPNVFRRDGFMCQFCGLQMAPQDLTLDHVVPRSMWNGNTTPTCWTNIVTACRKCNLAKANMTPEQANMPLRKLVGENWVTYTKPKTPTSQEIALGLTYRKIPLEWEIYVAPFRKSLQVT